MRATLTALSALAGTILAVLFILVVLAGCAACYREDRNADGSWPGYCADRFDSPNPTKKARDV